MGSDHLVSGCGGLSSRTILTLPFLLIVVLVSSAIGSGARASSTPCPSDADLDGVCTNADCDDTNADVYPGAPEVCDGVNNDCHDPDWPTLVRWNRRDIAITDKGFASVFAADVDGDGDADILSASGYDYTVAWHENTAGDGSAWVDHEISMTAAYAGEVFAADLDGDGDVDVLSHSSSGDAIAWYENAAGDGSTWAERLVSASLESVSSLFAVDMDGDGDVDALSASWDDGTVAWYENTAGDGSAWITHRVHHGAKGHPVAVSAADVDGDGDVDVLSADNIADTIAWHENTAGDGSTWATRGIAIEKDNVRSIFVADLDGDGDIDVVSASWSDDTVAWHENAAGDGSTWTKHLLSTSAESVRSVFAADVEGDGDLDILSGNAEAAWFENTAGDGSTWTTHSVATWALRADTIFAADLDGDGALDVLSGSRYSAVDGLAWYENVSIEADDDGDGLAECDGDCDDTTPLCTTDCTDEDRDGAPACADCDDGDSWSYPGAYEWCDGNDNACEGSLPADESDFDGDGYVACASWSDVQGDQPTILGGGDCDGTNAAVYPGAPEVCDGVGNDCHDPGSPSPVRWNEREISPTAEGVAHAADVDGDGDVDVLSATSYDHAIAWHENRTGDGSSWIEHRIPSMAASIGSVLAADVDGDDDVDVLSASSYDHAIAWHENKTGDGSSWAEHRIPTTTGGIGSVLAADVDGDGDVDVLSSSSYDATIAWYENTAGDGSAWTEHAISTTSEDVESIHAADVDGDGDVDVLSAFGGHTIAWHENTAGDGSEWTVQVISPRPSLPRSLFAADVDGDGDVDVLSASVGDDTIAWYENTMGDGSAWSDRKISTTAEGARSVFAVDLDGDNDVDALSASPYDDTIAWHENTAGDGSEWTEHAISTAPVGYRSVFAADLSGDGHVDVLSASIWDHDLVWYENDSIEQDDDGDGLAECAGDCDDTSANCTTDCTGDADGDGTHTCADCDDDDASIHPGAIELCDGNDNVCAGSLPEGELDHDGDGYVECADWNDVQDDQPSILGGDDCDDANAIVYPGAPEFCDGINSDCNHPNWPSLVDWDRQTISARDYGRLFRTDIDGDDDVDVLVAPGCNHELAWYENVAGDGLAWVPSTIPTTGCANYIFAVDLDGDDDIDVLSASYWENTIAWHENTAGDGSSWAEHVISTNAVYARAVFAADVDGDDDMDVLSASREGNKIAWYENLAGDGSTWSTNRISTTDPGADSIFAIDVDGDSDVDVLAARGYGGITFYENTEGDGSIWAEHAISTNSGRWVQAADMDGDGDADVLEVSQLDGWWPYTSAWHENTAGDGSAWTEHPLPIGGSGGLQLFPEDVDGDGDVDILSTTRYDDKIAWHENTTGDGLVWAEESISITAENPGPILAADVDGDGAMDVVASSHGDGVAWYRTGSVEEDGDGDGLAECEGDCDDTTPDCTTDCESDADGDGMPACSDCDDGDATTYRGAYERCDGNDNSCDGWVPDSERDDDGDGYVECSYWNDSQGDQPWILGSGDCDGSDADSYPGAAEVCDGVNNDCSDPNWPALDLWIEASISTTVDRVESVFAADVDGDGDLDVLAASWASDTIAWYEKTAGIGSAWAEHVISTTADGASSVFAVDVDRDGDVDVLAATWHDETIAWYENTAGDGSGWAEHVISTTAVGAFSVSATDVDGDGDVDVLAASVDDDTIALYENATGDGSEWTEHLLSTTSDGAASASGVDIDGDGDVDVLSASAYDDTIAWYENGPGVSSPWTAHPISTTADGVASVHGVDVDGDGDVDVLSASIYDDTIAWHENTAGDGSVWTAHEISTTVEGAYSVFAADLDGDGDVDALSASYSSGEVAWHENAAGDGSAWISHVASNADNSSASVFAADLDGDSDLDVLWGAYERVAWYIHGSREEDNDGDGLANCEGDCDDTTADCTTDCTDADGDGRAACHGDCDESDAASYPGAVELCDGNDNACNGWVPTGELDDDGDGYVPCDDWHDLQGDQPSILGGDDCDPADGSVYPGAPEVCDGLNNDCDHPDWPALGSLEQDDDGDGLAECEGDCDDTDPNCTTDCTGDADLDGTRTCSDCDDGDDASYPGAVELCDGNDNVCSGEVRPDELDGDGDGYVECVYWDDLQGDQPSILGGGDCDVADAATYPGAPEICDGQSNDCSNPFWPSSYLGLEQVISADATAVSVTVADVDGDGDLDVLAASRWTDTVAWHENAAGDGSAWVEHSISTTIDAAESVFAVDVDGDGDVDALSASFDDDRIAWHENTAGDGSTWAEHTVSVTANGAASVFAVDVDGDGDVDVLSASADDDTVAWYENTAGDGSAWAEHPISITTGGARSVFAVDVDGDGDVDVLSASADDDTVAWYENTVGDGSTWNEREISITADGAYSVFAADVDDDGDLDVLSAAVTDGTVAWYENTAGDGSAWNEREISTTAYGASAVFAADMDDDGDVDVLSALYSQGTVAWYENTAGDGSAWTGHLISNVAGGARSVVAADVDGDGRVNAISASRYANISWYIEASAEDVDLDGLHCSNDCDDWNPNCTTDCTDVDGDDFCITTDCDDARPYCTTDCTDADGDSFCVTSDCDEQNPDCNADCSDADSDGLRACEGDCDDVDPDCTTDCTDADGDGLRLCNGDCDDANPNCMTDCTDSDSDSFCVTTDCDDSSPACTTDCTDADGDDFRLCDGDCDDGDPGANPDETEDCTDGTDNDCNGLSDAVDPVCLDLTVTGLRLSGRGRSTLEWEAAAAADRYALYRGTIPRTGFAGYDHFCEAAQLDSTTAEDPDTPLRGEAYYYLVTGQEIVTEPGPQIMSGSLGLVSSGKSRPDSSTIDCGARVYVDPDLVAGSHDGLSWATAYTGVSGAMSHGQHRDRDLEVWIRGSLTDSAVLHPAVRSGARLLGGFTGAEAESWERTPETTSTTWAPRSSDVPVLRLLGTDVVLDGLTLRDGGTGVLGSPAGRLVVLDNVRIEQFSGDAVDLSFSDPAGSRLEVRESTFDVPGTGGLRAVSTAGSLTGRIRGNRFQGSGGTALRLEASPATFDASVAVDVVANTISAVETGILLVAQVDDLPYDAIQSSFLGSNLIYGTQGSSVVVQATGDFATSAQPAWALARPLIVGNTLSDGGAAGLRCLVSRTDTTGDPSLHEVHCDAEIWDNLITFHVGEGIEESSDDPATGLTCDPLVVGNDLYDNAAPYLDEGTTGLTIEEVNTLAGAYDNYSADPMYLDPAADDYHIGAGAAVDAGHPEATRIAKEDIDGECRVRDGDQDGTAKPDTGADER